MEQELLVMMPSIFLRGLPFASFFISSDTFHMLPCRFNSKTGEQRWEPPTESNAASSLGKRPAENEPSSDIHQSPAKAGKPPEAPAEKTHVPGQAHSNFISEKSAAAQNHPASRPATSIPAAKVMIRAMKQCMNMGYILSAKH
jgi:hypothetical protein